jgi:hypothetical protein
LSVLVDVGGREMLIDPGTFAYYDEHDRRNELRATRAHNTIEVGGRDQADPFDRFKWLNFPSHGVDCSRLDAEFDYVEAWHDGYLRLRPAVRHRRGVLRFAGVWLLLDWLEGIGAQRFTRWFHASPATRVEALDGGAARIVGAGASDGALVIRDLAPGETFAAVPMLGAAPYSERYAAVCDAPTIRFTEVGVLPALRITLLAPERVGERQPTANVVGAEDGATITIVAADGSSMAIRARAPGRPSRYHGEAYATMAFTPAGGGRVTL